MTGHSLKVTIEYGGLFVIQAMTGDEQRDPIRLACAWTPHDASQSFETMIGAIRHPL